MHIQKLLGTLVSMSVLISGCSTSATPTTTPAMSTTQPMSYKTYTDASLAFTFEHPSTWRVEKDSDKHVFTIIRPDDETKCIERRNNPVGGEDNAFECSPVVTITHSTSPQALVNTIGSQKEIKDFNALLDYRMGENEPREDIMFLGSAAKAGQLNDMGGGMVIIQQNQHGLVEVIFHNKADAWKESMKDLNEVEKKILNSFKLK